MKKFQFKFESLLQIKIKSENQEKMFFAQAAAALNEEEERLQALYDKHEELDEAIRKIISVKLDLMKLKLFKEMSEANKENIKDQKEKVKAAEHKLEAVRKRLNNAMVERKTFETLKEKAFDEYKMEYEREESKETDERTSFNFAPGEREDT